jgi:hypothetical protein
VKGKAPVLILSLDRRETRLVVDRFTADVELSEKKLALSVPEFSSSSPRASLQLGFVIDEEIHPRIDIRLEGRGDSAGARDFTLAMLQEIPEALLVCDIVRGGEVPDITVNLHGETWDDLAELKNLLIKGRLENGRIYIPWIDLDLMRSWRCRHRGRLLEGESEGSPRGGPWRKRDIAGGPHQRRAGLKLDIFTQGELSGLPRFLAQVVPDPAFAGRRAVQEFSGTASGMLHIDGTHQDVSVGVQAAKRCESPLPAHPYPWPSRRPIPVWGWRCQRAEVDVAVGSSKIPGSTSRSGVTLPRI